MTGSTPPFVLGTVQLGLDYGIANRAGQPPRTQSFRVLDAAMTVGVTTLDTAHAYGSSEAVIGSWISSRCATPALITKLPPLEADGLNAAQLAFAGSRERLGTAVIDGLLLHRAGDWAVPGLAEWLTTQRQAQAVRRIGLSIYSATELPDDSRIELVQLPANVFVQSEARSRQVERYVARGGTVHMRSVFAQGLLLMPAADIPAALQDLAPHVAHFQALAAEARTGVAALAISAVRRLLPSAEVVLGAETPEQVVELAQAARAPVSTTLADAALALASRVPAKLFDPRHWPATSAATGRSRAGTR